jgi:hypothetical protein
MLGVMHFFSQMGMGAGGWFPNISRKMHLALMRPCLEYAIGGLCMAKANVNILENAQRRALCKAVSVSSNQTSAACLNAVFGLPPMNHRALFLACRRCRVSTLDTLFVTHHVIQSNVKRCACTHRILQRQVLLRTSKWLTNRISI